MSAVKLSELRYWLRQPGMVVFLVAVIVLLVAAATVLLVWSF